MRAREARSSSRLSCSDASSETISLRISPPRKANGINPVEISAAHHASSLSRPRAIVTSRKVLSANT